MATIVMNAEQLTRKLELRDGRAVVVFRQGDDELVIVPREHDGWLSIWAFSPVMDRLAATLKMAELAGEFREGDLPPQPLESPLGGWSSGAC